MNNSLNIVWHEHKVKRADREIKFNQKGLCLWFTGLSGSGKSTLANETEKKLFDLGNLTYLLDGDNIRHGLNKDLGFSEADREENIRRIGEVVKLFVDAGIITLTAFISPFIKDRQKVRSMLPDSRFVEIFVEVDLETCEERDSKGLYKKARASQISNFTGVSSPYEIPVNPEIIIKNGKGSVLQKNSQSIINYLKNQNLLV